MVVLACVLGREIGLLVPDSALVAGHGFCIGVSGACSRGCAQGLLDLGERHGVIDRGGRSVLLACAIIVIGEVDGGLACVLGREIGLLVPDSALVAGHGFCIGVSGAGSGGCWRVFSTWESDMASFPTAAVAAFFLLAP